MQMAPQVSTPIGSRQASTRSQGLEIGGQTIWQRRGLFLILKTQQTGRRAKTDLSCISCRRHKRTPNSPYEQTSRTIEPLVGTKRFLENSLTRSCLRPTITELHLSCDCRSVSPWKYAHPLFSAALVERLKLLRQLWDNRFVESCSRFVFVWRVWSDPTDKIFCWQICLTEIETIATAIKTAKMGDRDTRVTPY